MIKFGIMLNQRTICLIPIPFSDLSSSKKRPVLIISNNNYNTENEDILVMAITSNITLRNYGVFIDDKDMEKGKILTASMVRIDKIYSIKQELVIKSFGELSENKFKETIDQLNNLIKN